MKTCLYICIITLGLSCTLDLPHPDDLVQEMYDAKVKRLQEDKEWDCLKAQLEKANSKVDSIVHQLLNKDLLDTISFPAKPMKPRKPQAIIGTVDSFEVVKKEEIEEVIIEAKDSTNL